MSIGTLIKTIQDIMRKDVGVDGDAQRISQIVWLLFLKIFDDKEQEWQLTISGYKSPLQSRFRWCNWAKNAEGITGDELIEFVNNELFPSLKKLATTAGVSARGKVVGSVFEDAYNYMKSGTLLRQVINAIEGDVDFNSSSDRHLFNDIYEKILADLQSAGNAGEYYTPRAVTQFMVDILNPRLGESVLDPACGTGGFLTCSLEYMKAQVRTAADRTILQDSIHGVEKKPLPHMLAMTNLMLHGIDVPSNVRHDNTLGRPLKDYGPKDRVDIILTNPPFGGMEEDGIENNFPRKYQTRETADLFMALIMHLLKHNTGRAAVVLPDGFLFGEGAKTTLKRELLEEFNLHTIVRLPRGVFAPYTSISTNILFFEKGTPTKDVWFFEHPYPDGYKSYSRSKPLTIDEFSLEKSWWGGAKRHGRKNTKHAWKVSVEDIAAKNYNLDLAGKNPHMESVDHGDPDDLRADYEDAAGRVRDTYGQLKVNLITAVSGREKSLLERHFDTSFAAPDGIRKLRELILTLAMQGKLVLQDALDQPAEEMLEKIRSARARQVKAGKAKPLKPFLPIAAEESLNPLPHSWKWVRLGEIAAYNGRDNIHPEDIEPDTWLLDLEDIEKSTSKLLYRACYAERQSKSTKSTFKRGDVLYGKLRPYLDKVLLAEEDGVCTTEIVPIVPYDVVDGKFLRWLLKRPAFLLHVNSLMYGVKMPRLGTEDANNSVHPLPPLKEQLRIVEKIDLLMAICDTLEQQMISATNVQTALLNALLAQVGEETCA
jgi:type I restriction enzyme M protein